MPERAATVPYDPTSQRTVSPELSTGSDYLQVRATPQTQVGQALDKVGQTLGQIGDKTGDLATHYAEMATEAKANDTIANQFAPAAAKLKQNFYSLQGKDAIAGEPAYLKSLQDLRDQFVGQAKSPYETQILGSYMAKHAAQETDGAALYANQQQIKFEDDSHSAFVNTLSGNIISNYNNPQIVDQTHQQMDAQIQKHGVDKGMSDDAIAESQRTAWGNAVDGAIKRGIANGDITTAKSLYDENKDSIDGQHRLAIDSVLHSENMRQYGHNAVQSLKAGNPIPADPIGSPPQVKASLAASAQKAGVDPNETFAVASMESDFGKNTGTRGTIGQDKESAGKTVAEQTDALVDNWQKAGDTAKNALGRVPQPWEKYTCYQQGAGGGPALLKAAQDDPMARAVDVVAPLYKTPQQALKAIVDNGGNASMTAGQFLDYIKGSYNAHLARTACMIPQASEAPLQTPVSGQPRDNASQPVGAVNPVDTEPREAAFVPDSTMPVVQPKQPNLADAILAPHQDPTMAVQPGANPTQALVNYDKVYPVYLQQANAIPDIDKRQAVLTALEQDHAVYQAAASAHKQVINNQAQQLAANPKFTDIAQVTPEMRSALADEPLAMSYLQNRAEYNLKNVGNIVSSDKTELGSGFYSALTRVLASPNEANAVNDASQLYGNAGKGGDLTPPGFDKLKSLLDMKNTPEGSANLTAMRNVFASAKSQITGTNQALGIVDTKGDKLFNNAMALMLSNYDQGLKNDKTPAQLLSPDSSDYIGSSIPAFKRSINQQTNDMLKDSSGVTGSAPAQRDLQSIINDVQSGKITSSAGQAEALKLGLIKADNNSGPAVPRAGVDE